MGVIIGFNWFFASCHLRPGCCLSTTSGFQQKKQVVFQSTKLCCGRQIGVTDCLDSPCICDVVLEVCVYFLYSTKMSLTLFVPGLPPPPPPPPHQKFYYINRAGAPYFHPCPETTFRLLKNTHLQFFGFS